MSLSTVYYQRAREENKKEGQGGREWARYQRGRRRKVKRRDRGRQRGRDGTYSRGKNSSEQDTGTSNIKWIIKQLSNVWKRKKEENYKQKNSRTMRLWGAKESIQITKTGRKNNLDWLGDNEWNVNVTELMGNRTTKIWIAKKKWLIMIHWIFWAANKTFFFFFYTRTCEKNKKGIKKVWIYEKKGNSIYGPHSISDTAKYFIN